MTNTRDDNGQQQQEQEAEEWHEYEHKLLDEIHEIVVTQIKENENV